MTQKLSTAEGGTDGSGGLGNVTVGNSGGANGDAFGTVAPGAGGLIEYTSEWAARGSRSYKFSPATGVLNYIVHPDGNSSTDFSVMIPFKLTGLPSSETIFAQVQGAAGGACSTLNLTTAGQLKLVNGNNVTVATLPTMTVGNEYVLSLYGYCSTTVGVCGAALYALGSTVPLQRLYATGQNNLTATAGRGVYGKFTATGSMAPFYMDDIQQNLQRGAEQMPILSAAQVQIDATWIADGAFDAPATATSTTPAIAGTPQENDVVYAHVISKAATAVATPTDWTLVGTSPFATGTTAGTGTGPGRIWVFRRVVPAGGITAPTFAVTGGNSTISWTSLWRPQSGYTNINWMPEGVTHYDRGTSSATTFGGTGIQDIDIRTKDAVVAVVAASDDQAGVSGTPSIAATGATIGAATTTYGVSATGNDVGGGQTRAIATAGQSTAAPVVTFTGTTAETGGGLVYRIRAYGEPATTSQSATDAFTAIEEPTTVQPVLTGTDAGTVTDDGTIVGIGNVTDDSTVTEGTGTVTTGPSATDTATQSEGTSAFGTVVYTSSDSAVQSDSSSLFDPSTTYPSLRASFSQKFGSTIRQGTVVIPGTVQPGDVGLILATVGGATGAADVPAGWTAALPDTLTIGGGGRWSIFTRKYQAGDANPIVDYPSSPTSGNNITLLAVWYKDCAGIDVVGANTNNPVAGTTNTCAALTTLTPYSRVLALAWQKGTGAGFPSTVGVSPDATIEASIVGAANFENGIVVSGFNVQNPSTTGAQTVTWDNTTVNGAGIQMALSPNVSTTPIVGSETHTTSESSSALPIQTATDTATQSDSSSVSTSDTKSAVDTFTSTDYALSREVIDTLPEGTLTESTAITATMTATDSQTQSDSGTLQTSDTKSAVDSWTVTDTGALSGSANPTASDSATQTEGASTATVAGTGVDSATTTESVVVSLVSAVNDTLTHGESVVVLRVSTSTDTSTLNESVVIAVVRSSVDSATHSETSHVDILTNATRFYVWNGTTAEALVLDGVWNGTTVEPVSYEGPTP